MLRGSDEKRSSVWRSCGCIDSRCYVAEQADASVCKSLGIRIVGKQRCLSNVLILSYDVTFEVLKAVIVDTLADNTALNNNNNNNSIQFNSSLLICRVNSQTSNYTNSTTHKHK
jgi:hypothetical protein